MRHFCLLLAVAGCSGSIIGGRTAGGGAAGGGSAVEVPAACTGPASNLVPMQRLTRREFEAAVADVLHLPAGGLWPASLSGYAYGTYADANPVSEGDAEQMLLAVEQLALQAADTIPTCGTGDETTCARSFLSPIATKLFRTASGPELDRLVGVFTAARAQLDYRESMAAALEALLLHPEFNYLVESVASQTSWLLDPHAAARRLSFVFTGTAPDAALLSNAATLTTPMALSSEATRLVHTAAGRAQLRFFLRSWLGLDGVNDTQHAPAVTSALNTELDYLLDRAIDAPDARAALFSARLAYVNRDLEDFYGLAHVSQGATDFREVELPEGQRLGVLSHPLVMSALAHAGVGSAILRGKLMRLRVLCGSLGTPPAGAAAQEPSLPATATNRQKYAARVQNAACAGCHAQMDPIGFAFEAFDGKGQFITGVDTSGTVLGGGDLAGDFNSLTALGAKLATSETAAQCLARQWLRFSLGRTEGADCAVARLTEQFAASGHSLSALFTSSAGLEAFSTRHAVEVQP